MRMHSSSHAPPKGMLLEMQNGATVVTSHRSRAGAMNYSYLSTSVQLPPGRASSSAP